VTDGGSPYLRSRSTAQYYHYGFQLVDFATAKIGRTIGLDVLQRSEIAKQQGSGNLDDGPGDRARTTPNAFDKALIDQKSQAGGMATYGGRFPFYSMWLYSVTWAFDENVAPATCDLLARIEALRVERGPR
jgi:hypothetical protein